MEADTIKNGEEAMEAYLKELHTMEHIGNYLGKYRQMIAEYDEAREIGRAIDALETVVRQQGRELTEAAVKVNEALNRLEELEKEFEDYKLIAE